MDIIKTKYICSRDRCEWKVYAGSDIWVCPFRYCIDRSDKKPYHRIRK